VRFDITANNQILVSLTSVKGAMILMKTPMVLNAFVFLHIIQSLLTDSIFVVRFFRYEDCSFFDRMLFVNETT